MKIFPSLKFRLFRKPAKQPLRVLAAGMLDSSVSDFNDERPQAQDKYAERSLQLQVSMDIWWQRESSHLGNN